METQLSPPPLFHLEGGGKPPSWKRPESVLVVVYTAADEVLVLLRRQPPDFWQSVTGSLRWDETHPLDAARRELREETGLDAAEWTALGRMNALNGIADAPEFVFLARCLTAAVDASVSQLEEGIREITRVPFADALAMIRRGDISDGETIAALALAGIHLGRFR